jgi:hypothetical protein
MNRKEFWRIGLQNMKEQCLNIADEKWEKKRKQK